MQGKFAEAEPLLQEALSAAAEVLGNDADSTLSAINNLGYLLQSAGKLDEAEP